MKKLLFVSLICVLNLFAGFEEGKKVFDEKCASCHKEYIPLNIIKENFFEKDNMLLNLKAPTANMIVWAMMDSSKRIGDPEEPDIQAIEIENFLRNYLEKSNRFNSICDDGIIDYYDNKKSMEYTLTSDDYEELAEYFIEYKENIKEDIKEKVPFMKKEEEEELLLKAKEENKKIIVYATSKTCFFCKKMDKEVLKTQVVKNLTNENYIFVEVDMDASSLPFNLQKEYKKITPSFFILTQEGEFKTQYPGSWTQKDYIEILKENMK